MKLHIPSRASKCHKDHPFENPVVSQLYKQDDGSWLRIDSCEKCASPEEAYCTWQSISSPPITESTPLLERFQNSQETDPKELFFLAEILLRQKKLHRRSRTKTDLLLEDAVTGSLYNLKRFDLCPEEARELSVKFLN